MRFTFAISARKSRVVHLRYVPNRKGPGVQAAWVQLARYFKLQSGLPIGRIQSIGEICQIGDNGTVIKTPVENRMLRRPHAGFGNLRATANAKTPVQGPNEQSRSCFNLWLANNYEIPPNKVPYYYYLSIVY